jgi:peptidoglycan biosynthesis protein MviN/MurJ (putative lipid II flippase)
MLRWQIGPLGGWQIVSAVGRIAGCALLMGYAVHLLSVWLAEAPGHGTALQIGRLIACITTGVAVYATAAFLCRSKELRLCRQLVWQRKNIP